MNNLAYLHRQTLTDALHPSFPTMAKIGPERQKNVPERKTSRWPRLPIPEVLTTLIAISTILGGNKLYLMRNVPRYLLIFSYFYTIFPFILASSVCFLLPPHTPTLQKWLTYIGITEYMAIVATNIISARSSCTLFYDMVQGVDQKFKIDKSFENELRVIAFPLLTIILVHVGYIWSILQLEYTFSIYHIVLISLLLVIFHDVQFIYQSCILKIIEMRLKLVNAHLNKRRVWLKRKCPEDKMTELANRCELSTEDLHQIYRSLFHCAQLLQKYMSFPTTLAIIRTFLTANILIMNMAERAEDITIMDIIFNIGILKNILLLFIPCSICSRTAECAQQIVFSLADILVDTNFDKEERRRLKVFHQECWEKRFNYWLCGVIPLDVTLPAKFISLCITYFIISLQFRKLIVVNQ